jgi:hypothetical protein
MFFIFQKILFLKFKKFKEIFISIFSLKNFQIIFMINLWVVLYSTKLSFYSPKEKSFTHKHDYNTQFCEHFI